MDREVSIKEEERCLKERKEKAKKLERSFELLRLCTEVLKEKGKKWAVTKERRELEQVEQWEALNKKEKIDKLMKEEQVRKKKS